MECHILNSISYLQGSVEGIDNEKLAHFCISEGVRYSEDPLHTRFEDFKIPRNEEWNKVFENIEYQYMSTFESRLKIINHWAAVHKKWEATNMHNHFGKMENMHGDDIQPDLAGVYYVQIPKDAGRLMFQYNVNQFRTEISPVEPVVGNFVIFPSTLNHYVTKNLADDLRISISFNAIELTKPEL